MDEFALSDWIDLDFYQRQISALNPPFDIPEGFSTTNATQHYREFGAAAGLSPHPAFSQKYYHQRYPDVQMDLFQHFIEWGILEGRSPHPMIQFVKNLDALRAMKLSPVQALPLFDRTFYLENNSDVRDGQLDPLQHYLSHGCIERRSPNPLFDVDYYSSQSKATVTDLFVDYLVAGANHGLNPHPLFDGKYALERGGFKGDLQTVFANFLLDPWAGREPHPLFNMEFYAAQVKGGFGASRNPLIHYLTEPAAKAFATHPLFDLEYYKLQLKSPTWGPLLLHYLKEGWRTGISPHPLFDPTSYEQAVGLAPGSSTVPPLVSYITGPHTISPHYLIDAPTYLRQRPQLQTPILIDYLNLPDKAAANIHPMFSSAQYTESARAYLAENKITANENVYVAALATFSKRSIQDNPVVHYLKHGWKAGLSPHNVFDTEYYINQTGPLDGDPLAHYLRDGGMTIYSPSVTFNLETYLSARPDCNPKIDIPFGHFLSLEEEERPATNVLLDKNEYLEMYADLRSVKVEPALHYAIYGNREERRPNKMFSRSHALDVDPEAYLHNETAAGLFLKTRPVRSGILFIGHDATLTGAPLILLSIIKHIGEILDCNIYTLLANPGPLENEFRKFSHTWAGDLGYDDMFTSDGVAHDPLWQTKLEAILEKIGVKHIKLAICNTVETAAFADILNRSGVPVISLIHEPGECYSFNQFSSMYKSSRTVIFPSAYTYEHAKALTGRDPDRFLIRGQGLLNSFIGHGDRTVARAAVRDALGIPEQAFIVLACGTADRRKGVDLFVEVAGRVSKVRDDVYFVWLGSGPTGFDSAKFWVEMGLKTTRARSRVRFVPTQKDVNQYYLAADLMLLPSRLDPFPCVVHEAMAAGLPIVAFEGCSGGPEAFMESGITVAAFDISEMAEAVLALLADPERREFMGKTSAERVRKTWRNEDYVLDVLAEAEAAAGVNLPRRSPRKYPGNGRKVFFLQPDWGISGVNTFSEQLVMGLRQKGLNARFVFTHGRFTPFETGHKPDLPSTFLQPTINRPDVIWATLLDFLHRERPCVVIPNYNYLASGVAPVAPEGVGFIGIAHSDDIEHYEHVYRLGLYWDQIVAVSDRIHREIGRLNPGFSKRLTTIRYGVPFNESKARGWVDARFDAGKQSGGRKPLRIVYSGRLVQTQKRILDFVELAERLQAADVPFRLELIGTGPEAGRLERSLRHFLDSGQVFLPGRKTPAQVMDTLAGADVFVLLSDFEGLPVSMLEAMSAGVIPVVRNIESGVREVVQDRVSGHICSKWNLEDMVSRLAELQSDPAKCYAMGHAAIDAMLRHQLTVPNMTDKYYELIEKVFDNMFTSGSAKPTPHAYNSPHYGISVPPAYYPHFVDLEALQFEGD